MLGPARRGLFFRIRALPDPACFIKNFRREGPGVWVCVKPATLDLPQGRVQAAPGTRFIIGTKFMNIDIAQVLDEEYSRHLKPRS